MSEFETKVLLTDSSSAGLRLDCFLAQNLPGFSRSYLQKQFKDNMVTIDGKKAKAGMKIKPGQKICITLLPPEELEVKAQQIPLSILYEDEDIIVIDKPKQMVVHPAAGHPDGTVVNALLYHCKDSLSGINGILRPGIVHRIDQDTTGVIVACKNDFSHRHIARQLKEHSITRVYHAIVHGAFENPAGAVESTIGRHPIERKKMAMDVPNGKPAVTHYKVLSPLNRHFSYIACELETGRTHQIRVHMAGIGHPVLGDAVYGPKKCPFPLTGQTLHAKILGFIHPRTGNYIEFEAPLPDYFTELLEKLGR